MKEGRLMMLTKIKDCFLQPLRIILPLMVILTSIIIAFIYFINPSTYNQGEVVFEASGRVDVDISVFYIENESFPNNPVSENLNFLMSFTDFIEIDSHFSARFSEEIEIHYSYTSVKRIVVRYRGSSSNEINPIVFEVSYPLSDISDSLTSREINFPKPDSHSSVGMYTIFPEQYIETYLAFVAEYERKNNASRNQANFFAELQIEFIYDINIPAWGMNEHITRSYHLPLSTEVYSFMSTGYPIFSQSLDLSVPPQQASLLIIVLFVVVFTLSAYFLFVGLRSLKIESSDFRREILGISKKYANEIVDSNKSILALVAAGSLQYTCIPIHKFESLLNLAINANEHIISYCDDERAEFVVVKGAFVYYYEILSSISSNC